MTTTFGWRANHPFGFSADPAPQDFDYVDAPAEDRSAWSRILGNVAEAVVTAGTPALRSWLTEQATGVPQSAGTSVTAPTGQKFVWDKNGKLVPVSSGLPGWVIPVAIGVGALVLLVVISRR